LGWVEIFRFLGCGLRCGRQIALRQLFFPIESVDSEERPGTNAAGECVMIFHIAYPDAWWLRTSSTDGESVKAKPFGCSQARSLDRFTVRAEPEGADGERTPILLPLAQGLLMGGKIEQ